MPADGGVGHRSWGDGLRLPLRGAAGLRPAEGWSRAAVERIMPSEGACFKRVYRIVCSISCAFPQNVYNIERNLLKGEADRCRELI